MCWLRSSCALQVTSVPLFLNCTVWLASLRLLRSHSSSGSLITSTVNTKPVGQVGIYNLIYFTLFLMSMTGGEGGVLQISSALVWVDGWMDSLWLECPGKRAICSRNIIHCGVSDVCLVIHACLVVHVAGFFRIVHGCLAVPFFCRHLPFATAQLCYLPAFPCPPSALSPSLRAFQFSAPAQPLRSLRTFFLHECTRRLMVSNGLSWRMAHASCLFKGFRP